MMTTREQHTTVKRAIPPVFVTFLVLIACFSFGAIGDADLLTQILLGRDRLANGDLFRALSQSLLYTEVTTTERTGWLAQVVLASVDALGGLRAILLLSAALITATFIVVARPFAQGAAGRWLALSVLFLVLASFTSARPQLVSFLGFATVFAILGGSLNFLNSIALFLTLVLWQNAHPSVLIALLPCAVFAARKVFRGDRNAKVLLPIVLVCIASLSTPDGSEIFSLASQNALISREVLSVSEWMPAWHPSVRDAMVGFWVALTLSLVLVASSWRNQDRWTLLEAGVLLVLTLFSARFAPYWALRMVAVWGVGFESVLPTVTANIEGLVRPLTRRIPMGMIAVLALGTVALAPVDPRAEFSTEAIASLSPVGANARVYNFYAAAGPIGYFGPLGARMHVDGRLYLFAKEFWLQYGREARGEVSITEIVNRYHPDAFFLWKPFQGRLGELLSRSPSYRRVFDDASHVVYVHETKNESAESGQ